MGHTAYTGDLWTFCYCADLKSNWTLSDWRELIRLTFVFQSMPDNHLHWYGQQDQSNENTLICYLRIMHINVILSIKRRIYTHTHILTIPIQNFMEASYPIRPGNGVGGGPIVHTRILRVSWERKPPVSAAVEHCDQCDVCLTFSHWRHDVSK